MMAIRETSEGRQRHRGRLGATGPWISNRGLRSELPNTDQERRVKLILFMSFLLYIFIFLFSLVVPALGTV